MSETPVTIVKQGWRKWVDKDYADEYLWELWPECSTEEDSSTPRMVFDRLKELEAKLSESEGYDYAQGETNG